MPEAFPTGGTATSAAGLVVVDASAMAGWLLPDEARPDIGALVARGTALATPLLFRAEFRNILLMAERRGRIPAETVDRTLAAVDRLEVEFDGAPSGPGAMALARRHGLTVHDALYLDLALRRGARLARLDGALVRAADAEGVALA